MQWLDKIKKEMPSLEELCGNVERSQGFLLVSEYYASLTILQRRILNNSILLAIVLIFSTAISSIYNLKSNSKNSATEKIRSISLIDNFHRENIDNSNKIRQLRYVEMKQRYPNPDQMIQEMTMGLNIPPANLRSDTQILKSNSAYEKVVTQLQVNKTNLNVIVQVLHRIENVAGNLMVNDLNLSVDPTDGSQINATIAFVYYQKAI